MVDSSLMSDVSWRRHIPVDAYLTVALLSGSGPRKGPWSCHYDAMLCWTAAMARL